MHSTVEEAAHLIRCIVRDELAKVALEKAVTQEVEPLIKIDEVVSILHVSKATIFTWIRKKKIPCHRMGSRLYFKRSEIIAALKNNLK